jgi:hypothetical protein
MIKMKAINTVVIACPSGLSDVVGYRDDGTAIVRERSLNVYSGEVFEIDTANAERLLECGAATRDLSYPLRHENSDEEAADAEI